jgi:hypothetical protein
MFEPRTSCLEEELEMSSLVEGEGCYWNLVEAVVLGMSCLAAAEEDCCWTLVVEVEPGTSYLVVVEVEAGCC